MATAVDQFLGKLQRTLSDYERRHPTRANKGIYRVTSVNEPYIDQKLDNCLVLERVGQGAMSVVYKAKQDFTDRIVAVKMLRAQLCCDASNVKRFQREAKAIARLSHQNLLNVYSVGQTKTGQPYIVMDFVEGKSLAELVQQEGRIAWERAAQLFLQVCDAMHHAHAHRIIHRDLKPDNIMLVSNASGSDLVKVVDFGIVKITDESQAFSQRLTRTGEIWGSPVYMSPEQCMGHELDHRSDIYSLGTVLYECLTGVPVFDGKRITDIVMKQLNEKPRPFAAACPGTEIPAWLEQITMQALEKEPKLRFNTMDEMKRRIEQGIASKKDTAQSAVKPIHTAPTKPDPKAGAEDKETAEAAIRPPQGGNRPSDFINKMIGGKFLVQSLVGDGGMSIVYKAMQQGINRPVAIKLLRDELCDDESNVKRFQREAKAVSQLSHPNLVAIYDVGTANTGQPYMVMEFLQGKTLGDLLEAEGPMPVERALGIFIQICDVMQYAHSKGFVHRDLKPHNVMLVKAGDKPDFVKLVDFGIVKLDGIKQAISQKLTAAGEICGSPIYMSPEQILDEPVDARSDVYSLGIVMYECLAGRPVFGGKRITDVLQKHVNQPPEPFAEACPDIHVPPALEGIIFKTLEKRPEGRFQSMQELKESLLSMARRMKIDSTSTMGQSHVAIRRDIIRREPLRDEVAPKQTGQTNKVILIAIACVLLIAAIAGGAVWWFTANHSVQAPISDVAPVKPDVKGQTVTDPTVKPVVKDANVTVAEPIKTTAPTVAVNKPKTTKPAKRAAATRKPPSRHSTSELLQTIEDAYLHPHRRKPDSFDALPD